MEEHTHTQKINQSGLTDKTSEDMAALVTSPITKSQWLEWYPRGGLYLESQLWGVRKGQQRNGREIQGWQSFYKVTNPCQGRSSEKAFSQESINALWYFPFQ